MFMGKFLIRLLAAVIAILIPFPVARYWNQRHGSPWSLFGTGCLTFVISQVFHIPFNLAVFQYIGLTSGSSLPEGGSSLVYLSIFLGLSAGVFEETTRYLAYRYRLTSPASRTFQSALMFGTGHGGIESILLIGLGGISQLIGMTVLRGKDLESMGIPADQVEMVGKQIQDYWALPWYGVLLADLERIFAITVHIALTVLVLQCFRRQQRQCVFWLILAILFHAGLDFFAVLLTIKYNIYITELAAAFWALASFGILWYFSQHDHTMDDVDLSYSEIGDTSSTAGADNDDSSPTTTMPSEATNTEFQRLSGQQ